MYIQYANCYGWRIEAILHHSDGFWIHSPSINILEYSLHHHNVNKEAIRQAANIWLNTLVLTIELQEYMNEVFPKDAV